MVTTAVPMGLRNTEESFLSEVTRRARWSPGSGGNGGENYSLYFISGYKRPVCLMPPAPATWLLRGRTIFLCLPMGLILAKPAKSSSQLALQATSSLQACQEPCSTQPASRMEQLQDQEKARSLCPSCPSSNHTDCHSQCLQKQSAAGHFCNDMNSF